MHFRTVFSKHFSHTWVLYLVDWPLKSALKTRSENVCSAVQNRRSVSRRQLVPYFSTISILNISTKVLTTNPGWHFYAPQTKILEGGTKDEIRIFDWLFNGSSPKSSTHALEKCFEHPDFIFCSSFQNLRLGGVTFGRNVQNGDCRKIGDELPTAAFGLGRHKFFIV
jgi:hypothetical protein